jgi:hypothetical protein
VLDRLGGIESDGGYTRFRSETLAVIAGHRWSALAHYGALSEPCVRHRCDARCCVRPDHPAVGTQAQNIADGAPWPLDEPYPHRSKAVPELSYSLRRAARLGDDK